MLWMLLDTSDQLACCGLPPWFLDAMLHGMLCQGASKCANAGSFQSAWQIKVHARRPHSLT
jgi:hypothetical protein